MLFTCYTFKAYYRKRYFKQTLSKKTNMTILISEKSGHNNKIYYKRNTDHR